MKKPMIDHFPGYEFVVDETGRHNMYRGIDLGLGGYVYSEPGMYENVALLDCASEHPTSIILLNKLGEYTKRYEDLRNARVYIKHKDYESVGKLFDGKLKKYLGSDEEAEALSTALKLPINSFYGISSASFANPARDKMDKNNIIALRGALFMKTLQDAVVEKGFRVVHIKTDSIKIPNATPEIIQFVKEFGEMYGYEMEHEATYSKMCLVNKAVYIAKYDDKGIRNKGGKHANEWTATGTQFQVPYIFKTLFTHEPIEFKDLCETKSVTGDDAIYLDMNESMVREYEIELEGLKSRIAEGGKGIMSVRKEAKALQEKIDSIHSLQFIGKCGSFCPIKKGCGGGLLVRSTKSGSFFSVTGTSGYRWLEAETVQASDIDDKIDKGYFRSLVDDAYNAIAKYGDAEEFING